MQPIVTSVHRARGKWVRPALSRLPSAAAEEGTREMAGDGAFTQS